MLSASHLTFSLLRRGADPGQILVKLAIRKALSDCESVLDVGCGTSLILRELEVSRSAGIEGFRPTYEEALRLKTHDELVCGDIRELTNFYRPGQYDACVALDVIEHLPKEDGLKLIRDMETIAKRKVVFFTPNGFLPQRQTVDSDLQAHFSGWETEEMRGRGYEVFGMLGPKYLRGEYHLLKRNPKAFWGMVSAMDQVLRVHRKPEVAAAILCVKSMNK